MNFLARTLTALSAASTLLRGDPTAPPQSSAPLTPRADTWATEGGFGNPTYDTDISSSFSLAGHRSYGQSEHAARDLVRFDAVAARFVRKPTAQAAAKGVEIHVDGQVDEDLRGEMQRLDVLARVVKARQFARQYGGAAIVLETYEGDDALKSPWTGSGPAQMVRALHVFTRWEVSAIGTKGLESETFRITPRDGRMIRDRNRLPVVHRSRIVFLDGEEVDDQTRYQLRGWGESVLTAAHPDMQRYGTSKQRLMAAQKDVTSKTYKIRGWHRMILSDKKQEAIDTLRGMARARSILRADVIDAEKDDVAYHSRDVKGLVEIHDALRYELAAALDMPMTELFGQAPAGLSSDDAAGYRRWLDRLDTFERPEMTPALEQIARWILGAGDYRVSVRWPALWQQSATESASARKTNAEADLLVSQLLPGSGRLIAQIRLSESDAGQADISLDSETLQALVDAAAEGDTGLDPIQLLQQIRLIMPTGALFVDKLGDILRSRMNLPPMQEGERESWLALMGRKPSDDPQDDPPTSGGDDDA